MNAANLYRNAVKIESPVELEIRQQEQNTKAEAKELAELSREQWLEHPITQKFIGDLSRQRSSLLNLCETSHGLDQKIVSNYLVESNTIRKVITYASTGKYE